MWTTDRPIREIYVDLDPRPKTSLCPHCARDVAGGKAQCVCVPSQPRKGVITTIGTVRRIANNT